MAADATGRGGGDLDPSCAITRVNRCTAHAPVRGVLLRWCRLRHRDGAGSGRWPCSGHSQGTTPLRKAVSSAGELLDGQDRHKLLRAWLNRDA